MVPRRPACGFGAALLLGLLPAAVASAQAVELRIDGFESGQPAFFQSGFAAGETGAVRLTPPSGLCPCRVQRVTLLFGGVDAVQQVNVLIWDDPDGFANPGLLLFDGTALLTGLATASAFAEVDLTSGNVIVTGPFRVGIEFVHSGLPSIARDADGTIDAANNFIFSTGLGWVQSALLGLTGDWIIRATVEPAQPPAIPTSGPVGLALLAAVMAGIGVLGRAAAPARARDPGGNVGRDSTAVSHPHQASQGASS